MPISPAGPFPSTDEIAARAHALFLAGGRRVAMIPHYWLSAERELMRQAARQQREPPRAPRLATYRRRSR